MSITNDTKGPKMRACGTAHYSVCPSENDTAKQSLHVGDEVAAYGVVTAIYDNGMVQVEFKQPASGQGMRFAFVGNDHVRTVQAYSSAPNESGAEVLSVPSCSPVEKTITEKGAVRVFHPQTITKDQAFIIRTAVEKRLKDYGVTFDLSEVIDWLRDAYITVSND